MKRLYRISQVEGLRVLRGGTYNAALDYFSPLNLDERVKTKILVDIENRSDFSISIEKLKLIKEAVSDYLKELMSNPEFDRVKKELRERYPMQYEHSYFYFEGIRYYVRGKGNPLDSKINSFHNFYRLVDGHIDAQQDLEYTFH